MGLATHTNGVSRRSGMSPAAKKRARAERVTGRRKAISKIVRAKKKNMRARDIIVDDDEDMVPVADRPVVDSPFGPGRKGTKGRLNGDGVVANKTAKAETVNIPPIVTKVMRVTLAQRDDSTLIVNHFNEKSRRQMLEAQTGAAKKTKEKRNPKADFELAKYKNSKGKDSIPAGWIRRAVIEAATFYARQISMKFLSGNLFVRGPAMIPISYDRCIMREDVVRNTNGVADLRFRPEYHGWRVTLEIEYEANLITSTQLVSLLDRAGFSIGIGEWRPQKKGEHGRFKVVNT